MAEANQLNQVLAAQLIGPKTQAQLMAAQQQQAIANALLDEGLKPIDTNGRSIGGVGYNISPWEGAAKLAQVLSGKTEQKNANQAYVDALTGSNISQGGNGSLGAIAGNLPPGALLNMDAATKAMFDNYYADHRPGAIYRNSNNGQLMNAPTDQQLNTGTAPPIDPTSNQTQPMGNAPINQSPPTLIPQPSITPVQGPNQIPPINMNTLMAPIPSMAQNPTPPPATAFQSPNTRGMTAAAAQAAIETAKAGASSQATENGKNIADATKGADLIDSRFDNSQAILDEMRRLAPLTSGGPLANIKDAAHSAFNDQTSANNKSFENLSSNQLTTALAPIIQGVGGRIDIPLLQSIKAAESVELTDSTKAKIAAIDNLKEMLERQRENAHNQVRNLTGQPSSSSPAKSQGVTHIWTPNGIVPMGQQ